MRLYIKMGSNKYVFDDDSGSDTPFDAAIDYTNDLFKSIFSEMEGMRLVALPEEVAMQMMEDMREENEEEPNLDNMCPEHRAEYLRKKKEREDKEKGSGDGKPLNN
jgi:hypothetical protein